MLAKSMATPQRILGIDPGTRYLGYGLIEQSGNRLRYLDAERLLLKPSTPLAERLLKIDCFLTDYIQRQQPLAVSVEGIFHHKYSDAALKLGHARGVVLCACARAGLAIFEYAPSDVKLAVTSYGRAEKRQVADMVRIILGVRYDWPVDASDALALAICHAQRPRLLLPSPSQKLA